MSQKPKVALADFAMFNVRLPTVLVMVVLRVWMKHINTFTDVKTFQWARVNGLNRIGPPDH